MNSLKAVEQLCPDLQFVTWPTGGKWYGFEHAGSLHPKPPFKETDGRIPEPYSKHVFYYNQHDALAEFAKGKKWSFADIRPDAIVSTMITSDRKVILTKIAGRLCAQQ